MSNRTNDEIFQEVGRADEDIKKFLNSNSAGLATQRHLDAQVTALKTTISNGPADPPKSIKDVLVENAGLTDYIAAIPGTIKSQLAKIPKAKELGTVLGKTVPAAVIAGVSALGIKLLVPDKLGITVVSFILRKLTGALNAFLSKSFIPNAISTFLRKIPVLKPQSGIDHRQLGNEGRGGLPSFRAPELSETQKGVTQIREDLSALSSRFVGLNGEMRTLSGHMKDVTQQMKHMNRELTGSAP